MGYNNKFLSLAIITALSASFALGYMLGSGSLPASKTVYVRNNDSKAKNNNASMERKNIQSDLSAKEALQIADQDALKWAKDSYISEIALFSKKFTTEGKSNGWRLAYYSKSKNKLYEIIIKDGESRGGEEKEIAKAPQTLKGELADSSQLAKTFFSNYPESTEIISLKMYYDAGAKKFIWTIFFSEGSHTIDAEM